jgi:hypothetical protein
VSKGDGNDKLWWCHLSNHNCQSEENFMGSDVWCKLVRFLSNYFKVPNGIRCDSFSFRKAISSSTGWKRKTSLKNSLYGKINRSAR